jgi:hypothetical protein
MVPDRKLDNSAITLRLITTMGAKKRQGGFWGGVKKHIGKGMKAVGKGIKTGLKHLGTDTGDALIGLARDASTVLGGPESVNKALDTAQKASSKTRELREIGKKAGTLTQGTVGMKRSSSMMNESSTSRMQGNRAGLTPAPRESFAAPTSMGSNSDGMSMARKRFKAA